MSTTSAGAIRIFFTRGPCARRMRTRSSRELDASRALEEPGVMTVLTQADVPGEGDSGANRHDEPLFPTEILFYHQPIAWVLGETLEAAQRGAARVTAEYEPLPAILTIEEAIEARSFLTEAASDRRRRYQRPRREPDSRQGDAQDRRPGTFLSGNAGVPRVDRRGRLHRCPFVDTASVGDSGSGRARPRRAAQSCDRRVPAHGRRVRRQGSAGQSVRGDCRAWRVEDEASRARAG